MTENYWIDYILIQIYPTARIMVFSDLAFYSIFLLTDPKIYILSGKCRIHNKYIQN